MRAIKRPIPIEVTVFEPSQKPWPIGVEDVLLEGSPTGRYRVWNELHKSWISLDPGDYVNVTAPGDTYPIAKAVFDSTYDIVP
jgi:hypothetical protein